jgi:transcriptional regulator with XRE-family HTH domain
MCDLEDFMREEIKSTIAKLGLSQKEIAEKTGLNASVVSRYLSGQDSKSSTVFKIIQALPTSSRSELLWKFNTATMVEAC